MSTVNEKLVVAAVVDTNVFEQLVLRIENVVIYICGYLQTLINLRHSSDVSDHILSALSRDGHNLLSNINDFLLVCHVLIDLLNRILVEQLCVDRDFGGGFTLVEDECVDVE